MILTSEDNQHICRLYVWHYGFLVVQVVGVVVVLVVIASIFTLCSSADAVYFGLLWW